MALIQWTPCEADAAEYDLKGPQVFDTEKLREQRASVLERWEIAMQLNIDDIVLHRTTRTLRAVMWLTLQMADRDIAWADFDPRVRLADFDAVEEDDADPPAEESASTSTVDE